MKLQFRGANREVTGSRHLLLANDHTILMDCGMYQGRRKDAMEKNKNFQFEPTDVDAVLLSHAHIDHSGNLPNLVKQGFTGPIYCTAATKDLLEYMLGDSAHIQEREAEWINKRKKKKGEEGLVEPLYTETDVMETLKLLQAVKYDECFEVTPGVTACFREAGHILGSALLEITVDDKEDGKTKKIAFSGDLGRPNMPLIRDPYQVKNTDYLMIESTYGNRLHESLLEAQEKLATVINNTISRGGRILIPAFSLGRTQEVVVNLHRLMDGEKIPRIPIYVDSPLSVNVTSVFRKHLDILDDEVQKNFLEQDEDPFGFECLSYTQSVEESKGLNSIQTPIIIISSSGMVEHGRILHHLRNAIEDHRNSILIVGYQAQHTLGRKLVEGYKEVNIFGEPHPVKIEVHVMNAYSAHADRSDLLNFVAQIDDLKKVILVHGEEESAEDLKRAINANGFEDVIIPHFGDELEL
jgi:metallo-beta-lactamase family protein